MIAFRAYAREAQTDSLPPFLSVHKLDGSQRHDVQQVIPCEITMPLSGTHSCLPLSRFWGLHLAGNPSKVLITASAMLSSKFIVLMLKVHLIYFTSRSLVLESIGTAWLARGGSNRTRVKEYDTLQTLRKEYYTL